MTRLAPARSARCGREALLVASVLLHLVIVIGCDGPGADGPPGGRDALGPPCDAACDPRLDETCTPPRCFGRSAFGFECDGGEFEVLPACLPCIQTNVGFVLCRADDDPERWEVLDAVRCEAASRETPFSVEGLEESNGRGTGVVTHDDELGVSFSYDIVSDAGDLDGTATMQFELATGALRTALPAGTPLDVRTFSVVKGTGKPLFELLVEERTVLALGDPRVDLPVTTAPAGAPCIPASEIREPAVCCGTEDALRVSFDAGDSAATTPFSGVFAIGGAAHSVVCDGFELTCGPESGDCGGPVLECAIALLEP